MSALHLGHNPHDCNSTNVTYHALVDRAWSKLRVRKDFDHYAYMSYLWTILSAHLLHEQSQFWLMANLSTLSDNIWLICQALVWPCHFLCMTLAKKVYAKPFFLNRFNIEVVRRSVKPPPKNNHFQWVKAREMQQYNAGLRKSPWGGPIISS